MARSAREILVTTPTSCLSSAHFLHSECLAWSCLASSPGLQLCGGKARYRLHAHALDFRILCRKIVRKRTGPQYPYVFGFCRFCRMLAHAHAVDTRPSLRIIEGLGTRLARAPLYVALRKIAKFGVRNAARSRIQNIKDRKECEGSFAKDRD